MIPSCGAVATGGSRLQPGLDYVLLKRVIQSLALTASYVPTLRESDAFLSFASGAAGFILSPPLL